MERLEGRQRRCWDRGSFLENIILLPGNARCVCVYVCECVGGGGVSGWGKRGMGQGD